MTVHAGFPHLWQMLRRVLDPLDQYIEIPAYTCKLGSNDFFPESLPVPGGILSKAAGWARIFVAFP